MRFLPEQKKLNRKRDVVYEEIMENLEQYGIHMLNFHKESKNEDRNYLERYFEAEVASGYFSVYRRKKTAVSISPE